MTALDLQCFLGALLSGGNHACNVPQTEEHVEELLDRAVVYGYRSGLHHLLKAVFSAKSPSDLSIRLRFTYLLMFVLLSEHRQYLRGQKLGTRNGSKSLAPALDQRLAQPIVRNPGFARLAERPTISVAVCIYNRLEYLSCLLDALSCGTPSSSSLRILIVDNSERPIVEKGEFTRIRLPANATIIRSQPPGLSRARNVAAGACGTDLIAFIDDDAIPNSDWLMEIVRVFSGSHDIGAVGGAIDPIWPQHRPNWIPGWCLPYLTVLDLGRHTRDLRHDSYLFGANMAFRVDALRHVGAFSERHGRIGSATLLSNEETLVQDELRRLGQRTVYDPKARVQHYVHENRLTPNWFVSRLAWQAVSDAIEEKSPSIYRARRQQLALYEVMLGIRGLPRRVVEICHSRSSEHEQMFVLLLLQILLGAHFLLERRELASKGSAGSVFGLRCGFPPLAQIWG